MPSTLVPLPRAFYERDPRKVARELLGKVLLRRLASGKVIAGRIVENEAYMGKNDPAAHAYGGITNRTAVLFGPAGYSYVYFTYGMHYCMNISCETAGHAGCLLIRALEPVAGFEEMAIARNMQPAGAEDLPPKKMRLLTAGPGRLCQALQITRSNDNGKDLTSLESDLLVVDTLTRGSASTRNKIVTTTRVGLSKAADKRLRYLLAGNPFVSVKP